MSLKRKHKHLTSKAFISGRSMIEGLFDWMPVRNPDRPRFSKDCLTERAASESSETKKVGQVSLTQLNPIDTILLEIASMGCLLRPSATTVSKCDGQFTHANFTRCPLSFTIHRESVCSGKAMTSLLWDITPRKIVGIDRRFRKRKRVPIFCLYHGLGTKSVTWLYLFVLGTREGRELKVYIYKPIELGKRLDWIFFLGI